MVRLRRQSEHTVGDQTLEACREHPLLGFEPLRDPNLEVVPKLIKVRHIYIQTADWKQRLLPVATEQHLHALHRVVVHNITLELPMLDSNTGVWRIPYVGPESGAFNPRVRKRAGTQEVPRPSPGRPVGSGLVRRAEVLCVFTGSPRWASCSTRGGGGRLRVRC